eukprot:CAMPEP_0197930706 /NCGR_PEP_ID=MMETSP1439-20131203/105921_1 /TAXON_ID=66791 /ORGANISM="Gonyaulax spinifera, Strain CCMP409" /LENGTH=136 /DNA_ID=CAMNT_0043553411 /DNA_START=153 /DNA_END=563 /DNA_ORIENTATION=+
MGPEEQRAAGLGRHHQGTSASDGGVMPDQLTALVQLLALPKWEDCGAVGLVLQPAITIEIDDDGGWPHQFVLRRSVKVEGHRTTRFVSAQLEALCMPLRHHGGAMHTLHDRGDYLIRRLDLGWHPSPRHAALVKWL